MVGVVYLRRFNPTPKGEGLGVGLNREKPQRYTKATQTTLILSNKKQDILSQPPYFCQLLKNPEFSCNIT